MSTIEHTTGNQNKSIALTIKGDPVKDGLLSDQTILNILSKLKDGDKVNISIERSTSI